MTKFGPVSTQDENGSLAATQTSDAAAHCRWISVVIESFTSFSTMESPIAGCLGDLLPLWQHDDVIVECMRPHDLEETPDFAERVRAALGNRLDLQAAAAPPCQLGRKSAYALLYGSRRPAVAGWDQLRLAPPMVVRAAIDANRVRLTVRLFGAARFHSHVVAAALIDAAHGGIRLRHKGVHVAMPVTDARIIRFDGGAMTWTDTASSAALRFVTPLSIRARHRLHADSHAVLRSAVHRIAALVPWMGLSLEADMEETDHCIAGLTIRDRLYRIADWERHTRNAAAPRRSGGFRGTLHVAGRIGPLLPFLDAARFTGLGGGGARGYGAADIVFYP